MRVISGKSAKVVDDRLARSRPTHFSGWDGTIGGTTDLILCPLPQRAPARILSPMKIRKAIITSAGKDQRTIPLQTFVDRDGRTENGACRSSSRKPPPPAPRRSRRHPARRQGGLHPRRR